MIIGLIGLTQVSQDKINLILRLSVIFLGQVEV